MALESATYISDLNTSNPAAGDSVAQGDDHLRLIKSTLKTTFPNVTGAANPTHTQLNYLASATGTTGTTTTNVVFSTSPTIASPTFTGTTTLPTLTGTSNVTEMRNGASGQSFRIYSSYTDATNFVRGDFHWNAGEFWLTTYGEGTGVAGGNLVLNAAGSSAYVRFRIGGAIRWNVNSTAIYPETANTSDLGTSTYTVRTGYFGTSVSTPAVAFPATQVASADANTLDDYEEGTFTPTIRFGAASSGITYSTQDASYTKIGRAVHFRVYVVLSSKGTSTGAADITGLPFTSSGGNNYSACAIWINGMSAISGGVTAFVGPSTTAISLRQLGTGTASSLDDTNFSNTSGVMVSGTYFV